MKPLVTKETIFKRRLDGKPIVVNMMLHEQRKRFGATRELFFEVGVYKKMPQPDDHGRNCIVTHEIHFIVPRSGEANVAVVNKGHVWFNEVWGASTEPHYLP